MRRRSKKKWEIYSGLFVLFKKRLRLKAKRWREVLRRTLYRWRRRIFPPLSGSV
jgi:hypothetical protein